MKALLLSATMLMSLASFAEVRQEFDEQTEIKCHEEMKALGCVKADQESQACAELNKQKLSAACKSIHEARKKK